MSTNRQFALEQALADALQMLSVIAEGKSFSTNDYYERVDTLEAILDPRASACSRYSSFKARAEG